MTLDDTYDIYTKMSGKLLIFRTAWSDITEIGGRFRGYRGLSDFGLWPLFHFFGCGFESRLGQCLFEKSYKNLKMVFF